MMAPMVASLIAPMASTSLKPVVYSVANAKNGKRVMRAEKGQEGKFLPLLVITLMTKVPRKGTFVSIL